MGGGGSGTQEKGREASPRTACCTDIQCPIMILGANRNIRRVRHAKTKEGSRKGDADEDSDVSVVSQMNRPAMVELCNGSSK